MFNQIMTIVQKEIMDASRDRRSLFAVLAFAIFNPILLFVMFNTLAKSLDEDAIVKAALVGGDQAPTLVEWLEQREMEFVSFDDEASALEALDRNLLTALVFPQDYQTDYLRRSPASIRIYADFKRDEARTEAERMNRLIEAYSAQVGAARLIAEGVGPQVASPIAVDTYDLSRAGGVSVQISGLLTYLFLLSGFISGAFMAADAIAGEKERHSLQPLLAQPVTVSSLVIGKWMVAALVAMGVSTITILFGGTLLSKAPLAALGIRFFTTPSALLLAAFAVLPLSAMAAALQIMLAAGAKTYREAATYAQYTMFLPILVVGATQFAGLEYGDLANFLPITGHNYAMREVFLEGTAPIIPIFVTAISSAAVTALLIWRTIMILRQEKAINS